MLQCETVSGISTPWSRLLFVSVLPTEKYTNKICVRWILCFAGCCVPLLGHLVTWIGRCRFVSFRSLASVTHGHGTQALYWRCAKQKDCAKIFHCFKSENKASSRSAPPTTAVASLYTLDPQEFFGRPRRCGCSTIRGRRV